MHEIWRGLKFVLSLGLLLGGCVSAPDVRVATEVFDPAEAKNRSVTVVADLFMEDQAEAERVAGLIREELSAKGFKVHEREEEADLVIISTVERSAPSNASATPSSRPSPRTWRSFDPPYGLGRSSMTESQNALWNLGFQFEGASAAQENPKAGLMVTAVTRETWLKALLEEQKEIPRVWRIIAVSSLRDNQDITPDLVEAVGSKLGEVTNGRPERTQKPRPSPHTSSQRKPASS